MIIGEHEYCVYIVIDIPIGLQTAYAACFVESSETRLNDSLCSAASKPNVSSIAPKACNTHACDSYEWVSKAGTCSVSCGDGKFIYSKSPHIRTYFLVREAEIGSYFKGTNTNSKV